MLFIIPLFIVVCVVAWLLRPQKDIAKPSKVAILVTAVISTVVAVAAVIFQLLHNAAGVVEVSDISNTCFIIGLSLIGAYLLTSIVFVLMHKGKIAKGIGFGTCIAIVVSIVELGLLEWLGGV
ncbi:MAG: hypothetical protein PHQ86_09710 [Dehalococcoidales bacterium]|nr:hypothetical protein [Dehalococcoidales bacterium]